MANAADTLRPPRGYVVTYSAHERGYHNTHERATRRESAKRLAALKGFAFAGDYDPSARYDAPLYFLPSDALVGVDKARDLGIASEHDLFGGIVPHAFVSTKAITHPLVDGEAFAPDGWSQGFAERVRGAVLSGFSAFSVADARRAGARLLEAGPIRIKPVHEAGGRGQIVVSNLAELDRSLTAMDPEELSRTGLVLEENLVDVTTYSVGQVRVADLVGTYHGTQRMTRDNAGALVYGGSDLTVFRGDFEGLLGLDVPDVVRLAIRSAGAYDRAAMDCFPGLFASRRNYDVARGSRPTGERACGVLEQSWRFGGASGAEIAALETFRADSAVQAVRASTFEHYGECEPPPDAAVSFRGVDERVGAMTKYSVVWR